MSCLMQKLDEKITKANDILKKVENFSEKKTPGAAKLVAKIQAELRFLERLKAGKMEFKDHHLSSTNLMSLEGLVSVAQNVPSLDSLLDVFHFSEDDRLEENEHFTPKQALTVDIVCEKGTIWIKVIARNAKALLAVWEGRCSSGEKSISSQADLYLTAANSNLRNFNPPRIFFVFCKGVPLEIQEGLENRGISVKGTVTDAASDEFLIDFEELSFGDESKYSENLSVNLDVTALICLVSNLCHGFCNFAFSIPVLSEQAEEERKSPVLSKLEKFLEGKKLFSCESAVNSFKEIVKTISGPQEKLRAEELLKRIDIVPDQPSERTLLLHNSGKINKRSKIIFGTGDSLKAVTVTANTGFVRAASQNGERFDVFIHEARALTESKEKFAKAIVFDESPKS